MAELYGLVLAGLTVNGATRWLNDRGLTTYSGRPWDRSSVRRMLLSPRNAGLRAHLGEIVGPGNWTAIVSEEVWRAVVGILTDRARNPYPTNVRKWLGTGLYRCHCGGGVRVNYSRRGIGVPGASGTPTCLARPSPSTTWSGPLSLHVFAARTPDRSHRRRRAQTGQVVIGDSGSRTNRATSPSTTPRVS